MKKKSFILVFLMALLIVLSACNKSTTSKKNSQNNLPSASKIFKTAQNTNINNMNASWRQESQNGRLLQKASAKYNKKPLVVFANFTTSSNHYRMWIEGRNNYIQMQGTASKRWFKTKLGKSSSYAMLTDDIVQNTLASLSSSIKKFKVRQNQAGYLLTYNGKDKKLFSNVLEGTMITSLIGIDQNQFKPQNVKINLQTNKKMELTSVQVAANYQESSNKTIKFAITDINQAKKKLTVPSSVKKTAVDLGKN